MTQKTAVPASRESKPGKLSVLRFGCRLPFWSLRRYGVSTGPVACVQLSARDRDRSVMTMLSPPCCLALHVVSNPQRRGWTVEALKPAKWAELGAEIYCLSRFTSQLQLHMILVHYFLIWIHMIHMLHILYYYIYTHIHIYIYMHTRIHIIYNIYEILWDRHDVAIYGNRLNDWTTGAKPGRWPLDSGRLAVLRWSLPVFHGVGPWIKHNDESSMKHKYHKYRIISITISLRWWQILKKDLTDSLHCAVKIWEILSSEHQILISWGVNSSLRQDICLNILNRDDFTEVNAIDQEGPGQPGRPGHLKS